MRKFRSSARRPALLVKVDSQQRLFFFVDDDSRGDHEHEALGLATDTGVLEEPADVRNLVEDRHTGHVAAFAESFDSAQQNCSAVRHADRGLDRDGLDDRLLDGAAGCSTLLALLTLLTLLAATLAAEAALATLAAADAAEAHLRIHLCNSHSGESLAKATDAGRGGSHETRTTADATEATLATLATEASTALLTTLALLAALALLTLLTLLTLLAALSTAAAAVRAERGHFDQVVELRSECQSNEASVGRDNRCDCQRDAVRDEADLRSEPDRESSDGRLEAQHERSLRPVKDRGRVTVEESHLRSEQQVGSLIGLDGPNEEEGLNVAQDGKSHLQTSCRIEVTEVRHTDVERTLSEGHVQVLRKRLGTGQTDDRAVEVIPIRKVTLRWRSKELSNRSTPLSLLALLALLALLTLLTLLALLLLTTTADDRAERRQRSQ